MGEREVLAGAAEVVSGVGGHDGDARSSKCAGAPRVCAESCADPCVMPRRIRVARRSRGISPQHCACDTRFRRDTAAPTFAPMLARVTTFALDGPRPAARHRRGRRPPGPAGLHDRRPRRRRRPRGARARPRGALNSGFEFPRGASSSTSRPPHLRKAGPASTSRIAAGVLAATGQVPAERARRLAVFGELSLGGELRAGRGTLAVAEGAARAGLRGLVVPRERAAEAALVEGSRSSAVGHARRGRRRSCAAATGRRRPSRASRRSRRLPRRHADLADVHGHADVDRRAARSRPPAATTSCYRARPAPARRCLRGGCRRSCRRSRAPRRSRSPGSTASPASTRRGARRASARSARRTTRSPRRASSAAARCPAPGEASLAHHGVLFLDELSEFPRPALEALRQPLEDGRVASSAASAPRSSRRASCSSRRRTRARAATPATSPRCRCTDADLARYRRRLSGPLLDRIDLVLDVQRPAAGDARAGGCDRPRPPSGDARRPPRATPGARGCAEPARVQRAMSPRCCARTWTWTPRRTSSCSMPTTRGGSARAATTACSGSRARSPTCDGASASSASTSRGARLAPRAAIVDGEAVA